MSSKKARGNNRPSYQAVAATLAVAFAALLISGVALNKIIETVSASIDPGRLPPAVMVKEPAGTSSDGASASGARLADF